MVEQAGDQTEEQVPEEVEAFVFEPPKSAIDSDFNHMIVGVSARSLLDDLDHINIYKIIKIDEGFYQLFDFNLDAISVKLSPNRHLDPLPLNSRLYKSSSLMGGSLIWTEEVQVGEYTTKQM